MREPSCQMSSPGCNSPHLQVSCGSIVHPESMNRFEVHNRKGERVVVLVEQPGESHGLAFVMHGLGGFKEQPHIATVAETLREHGYAAVRFDTTNTFGESDGRYEDATTTNYYEDLEDVVAWAATQPWYREPFVMAGHSLGGLCICLFAQKHPEKVSALIPMSPVVSGKLSLEANPDEVGAWRKSGWRVSESRSRPGVTKRLPWSHMEDRLKYDLLPTADRLTMPVLLIVASGDDTTPASHVRMLHDALPGPKRLHIIEGEDHTFRKREQLDEIRNVVAGWLRSI